MILIRNYGFGGCFTRPTADLGSQLPPRICHVEACRPRRSTLKDRPSALGRNIGSFNWQRAIVAVIAAALIPVATSVDALAALAIVAALAAGLIAYEAIRFREARKRIRALLA